MNAGQQVEAYLEESMGLHAGSIGSVAIERAVRQRLTLCGLDSVDSYLRLLRTSESELQELTELTVVPETWFFRDSGAFAALVSIVMDDWLPAHPTGPLRALSMPCSSGEEPYSIAMALSDASFPMDRLRVLGVDISRLAIERARAGVYRPGSFRGADLGYRDRHFEPVDGGFRLRDDVRRGVRFEHGNILRADGVLGADRYDIIFCRNVLIYFDRPAQQRVLERLDRHLAIRGVLFVGSAEAFWTLGSGFRSAQHPMAFAYRRAGEETAGTRQRRADASQAAVGTSALWDDAARPTPGAGDSTGSGRTANAPPRRPAGARAAGLTTRPPAGARADPARSRPRLTPATPPAVARSGPADSADALARANSLADAGRLFEAAAVCEAEMLARGDSAAASYLLGLVRDAQGRYDEAAACYRRALYLEPNHPDAALHLALLAEKQGDPASAQRLIERARRIAGRARPEDDSH